MSIFLILCFVKKVEKCFADIFFKGKQIRCPSKPDREVLVLYSYFNPVTFLIF